MNEEPTPSTLLSGVAKTPGLVELADIPEIVGSSAARPTLEPVRDVCRPKGESDGANHREQTGNQAREPSMVAETMMSDSITPPSTVSVRSRPMRTPYALTTDATRARESKW